MGNILEFRHRPRLPKIWDRYRRRWRWPKLPVTPGELRITLLLGALLGLGYSYLTESKTAWTPEPYLTEARFSTCGGSLRYNCVIDGDTFYFQGEKIRIADIDTPETHPPRCPEEAELGGRATDRLRDLLNAGPFQMIATEANDADRYGRKLRTVYRDGQSIGEVLVSESLARPYSGGWRAPWCG